MEEVGRKIAKNCQGLPLSIVVIGGLLVASKMTLDTWEYVADNINKIMSSEDSDCLDILSLSYKHLPIHLQPCFLYIGVYPEDHIIRASELINLWVAEGLIKPSELKTLEEVAGEYLKDLIERRLIMVNERGSLGTMKTCIIHDLLRDLCLREAHKEKFLLVDEVDKLQDSSQFIIEHRVAIQHKIYVSPSQHAFESTLLVRSLTFYLVHLLWNLQTLVIHDTIREKPFTLQIWKMPHLRHLICTWHHYIRIPDPQNDRIDNSVLENLQTLSGIQSFKCTEEVVRRIPNVKKLVIVYNPRSIETGSHNYLKNIGCLHKLQSLTLRFTYGYLGEEYIQNCVFPNSLKKLALMGSDNYTLEDIIKRTGWLPHLEKLKLKYIRSGEDWNPVEGQFLRLKVLKLKNMYNLEYLRAESAHFPVLEHLHLKSMYSLKEISSGIGEIATLQSITLKECEASVVASAKYIMDEQQSFGNEGLRLANTISWCTIFKVLLETYLLESPSHGAQSSKFSTRCHDDVAKQMAEFDAFKTRHKVARRKSQLDLYLEEELLDWNDCTNLNILDYWKENCTRYPELSLMARDILSIPITTVASESAFSHGGRIIGKFRSSILPENAEATLCTRDWLEGYSSDEEDEDKLLSMDIESLVGQIGSAHLNE
ncbi:hypothetical protein RD792_017279 [Penstemon davidsonii]|uniref:NB-ARC domain-containing protein n=1 Tax=Penstemon davidsonii TaxID=160366 RepID=A0ABR0CLT1_9LAMI|nr:hypothetical protein RD792_017279 [Penstemon davidsonii]